MKKQIAILAALVAATSFSAFGQGYITFASATSGTWDEFTTPGAGIRSPSDVTVGFLWAATSATDSLTLVSGSGGPNGNGLGLRGGAANKQVATNGVSSISVTPWATIATMVASGGWNWATNSAAPSAPLQVTGGANGLWSYNGGASFILAGPGAGSTIQIVVIGWNNAGSIGSSADIGWSNPFNYLTGANASDPNGTTVFSSSGANQFGVAPIPEPSTIALAGLGGLSLLLFRRRK